MKPKQTSDLGRPLDPKGAPAPLFTLDIQIKLVDLNNALLRHRPDLDQEVAALGKAYAAKLRQLSDKKITVAAAAKIARVDIVTIRKWAMKHSIGERDPLTNYFVISRRKLEDLLRMKGRGFDPGNISNVSRD
jgi:hypothetical protein